MLETINDILNFSLFPNTLFNTNVGKILLALLILLVARVFYWLLIKQLLPRYYKIQPLIEKDRKQVNWVLKYIILIISLIFILGFTFDNVLRFTFFPETDYQFQVINLLVFALILFSANLVVILLTRLILPRYYQIREMDQGERFAINQILKYVLYTIAILVALQSLGIHLTVLWVVPQPWQ